MARLHKHVTKLYFGSFLDTYQPHVIEEAREDFMNVEFHQKGEANWCDDVMGFC